MLVAAKNGKHVVASDFAHDVLLHGQAWFEKNNNGFYCPQCKATAHYVRASTRTNLKGPHFRVMGKSTCPHASQGTTATGGSIPGPLLTHINTGGVVAIRFGTPSGNTPAAKTPKGATKTPGTGTPAGPTNQQSETFERLLMYLKTMPSFPDPSMRVSVPDRSHADALAIDYFRNMNALTSYHTTDGSNGKRPLLAYWGEVTHVDEYVGGNVFLNFASGSYALIIRKAANAIMANLPIRDWKDLEHQHVIFESRLTTDRHDQAYGKLVTADRFAAVP